MADVGEAPVRLTRRGRAVLVTVAAAMLLAGFWITAGRGQEAGASLPGAAPAQPRETVIAGDRDTLWAIAVRTRPGVDPRITVQRLIDINELNDGIIQPGQRLILPGR
jgi:LysM domain